MGGGTEQTGRRDCGVDVFEHPVRGADWKTKKSEPEIWSGKARFFSQDYDPTS